MTPAELAARLHGREYGEEVTRQDVADAKAAGLVMVFGASDDLMEFRGAMHDELGAYEGTEARLSPEGPLPDWDDVDHDDKEACQRYFKSEAAATQKIEAVWCPKATEADTEPFASWAFKTAIPHATFDVMEDGDIYCRGIVFAMADAFPGASA